VRLGAAALLVLLDQLGRHGMRFERLHQALEAVLLVELLQRVDLLRADRDRIQRRQAGHMLAELAVGADRDQPAALRQPVEGLAAVRASVPITSSASTSGTVSTGQPSIRTTRWIGSTWLRRSSGIGERVAL